MASQGSILATPFSIPDTPSPFDVDVIDHGSPDKVAEIKIPPLLLHGNDGIGYTRTRQL